MSEENKESTSPTTGFTDTFLAKLKEQYENEALKYERQKKRKQLAISR
jgi:hypothetical protein